MTVFNVDKKDLVYLLSNVEPLHLRKQVEEEFKRRYSERVDTELALSRELLATLQKESPSVLSGIRQNMEKLVKERQRLLIADLLLLE